MTITPAHSAYNAITSTSTLDPTSITAASPAVSSDVDKVVAYQTELEEERTMKQSLLDEINATVTQNMMVMAIWVPLGILAGYYLYKKNYGVVAAQ